MTKRKWDPKNFAAFVGIDWADKKHDVCVQRAGSTQRRHLVLAHKVAVIDEWAGKLKKRFEGRPVAVCLELKHGPIVTALVKHKHLVIFPVEPTTLANYRRTLRPSGAKDDKNDAELALDFLQRFPDKLSPLSQQSAKMRTLDHLVTARRQLVDDTTRLTNRLTWTLKAYFPQVLDWFDDKRTVVFCDFLGRFPSLQAAQAADNETLTKFFKQHNIHRKDIIARRIGSIRSETVLTDDTAIIEPNQMVVAICIEQLKSLVAAIRLFDDRIAQIMDTMPDAHIFQSLPAAGPVMTPRLLTAFGEDRRKFKSAAAVQRAAGVAPVTEASGNQHWVHWRWSCSKFLRQSFVEWAALTIPKSFWAAAYYRQMKERGISHNAAVRSLAFKWIRILYRLWVQKVPYDESKHLASLQRRGSPLLKLASNKP